MPSKKVKDLAVKTGSYQKDGETKGRYENIGSMFKSEDGSFFLMLKRTFNPAGVTVEEGRDSILVGVFDLRDDQQQQQRPAQQTQQQAPPPQSAPVSSDDDLPF